MVKFAITLLLMLGQGFHVLADEGEILKRNPPYWDRVSKEAERILKLNQKFKSPDVLKECKGETVSSCYTKQLKTLHDKEKLSINALVLALPAGTGLVLIEKEQQQRANPKISTKDLNLPSHKKQTELTIQLIEMSCTRATAKDWGVTDKDLIALTDKSDIKTIKELQHNALHEIEQVRKFSEIDAIALKTKFNEIYPCGKKN